MSDPAFTDNAVAAEKDSLADPERLLSVRDLKVHFPIRRGVLRRTVGQVRAVDGVDLDVRRGEVLGLVGESGCGKTTTGKAVLRLIEATSGEAILHPDTAAVDLLQLKKSAMDTYRSQLQIVFQDPYSSLNPALTVFQSLQEPLAKYRSRRRSEQREIVAELFRSVNLPVDFMDRYPNEFSGGQRQRIGIARALLVEPELVVCDEAVSALDVSVQAQVLNLLQDLRSERDLTYIFISHNMSVVEYIADRIAVMYLGRVVELADADELYSRPLHPYTQALLSAIPSPELGAEKDRIVLSGDVPSPANPPTGCPFHPRCPHAEPECATTTQTLRDLGMPGKPHQVACHLAPLV